MTMMPMKAMMVIIVMMARTTMMMMILVDQCFWGLGKEFLEI